MRSCCRCALLEPVATRSVVRRAGGRPRRARRRGRRSRSCACRRPSAKAAASRSASSALARSQERQARARAGRIPPSSARRSASRESPSMIAFRHRPLAGARSAIADGFGRRATRRRPCSIANVEEARYRALVSEDGGVLVEARYAVRNNQRSFLEGRRCRPARRVVERRSRRPSDPPGLGGRQRRCCCRSRRDAPGEEAPTFVVDLVYLQRIDRVDGQEPAAARAAGVGSSGVANRMSSSTIRRAIRVEPQAGAFRVDVDPGPFAAALRTRSRDA